MTSHKDCGDLDFEGPFFVILPFPCCLGIYSFLFTKHFHIQMSANSMKDEELSQLCPCLLLSQLCVTDTGETDMLTNFTTRARDQEAWPSNLIGEVGSWEVRLGRMNVLEKGKICKDSKVQQGIGVTEIPPG